MLIMGEAMNVYRRGIYKKPLYLPLDFVVNLKFLLKIVFKIKFQKQVSVYTLEPNSMPLLCFLWNTTFKIFSRVNTCLILNLFM